MKTYDDGESVRPKTGKKPLARERRTARQARHAERQAERLAEAEAETLGELRDF